MIFWNVSTLRNKTFAIFAPYMQLIRKKRLSEGHIKWQMLPLPLGQHLNLGEQDNSYLHAARLYLHCPASAPANLMSNTELIILLCELMLIFLCVFISVENTNALPAIQARN